MHALIWFLCLPDSHILPWIGGNDDNDGDNYDYVDSYYDGNDDHVDDGDVDEGDDGDVDDGDDDDSDDDGDIDAFVQMCWQWHPRAVFSKLF